MTQTIPSIVVGQESAVSSFVVLLRGMLGSKRKGRILCCAMVMLGDGEWGVEKKGEGEGGMKEDEDLKI